MTYAGIPIIVLLTSLALLIFILIYAYYLHKRITAISEEEFGAQEKADEIVKFAHEKAQKILKKSMDDAEALTANTESFKQNLQKSLRTVLNTTIQKYTDVFQKELNDLLQTYRKQFIEKQESYIKATEALMKDQKISSQYYLQKKIEEEIALAKKSIEEHKKSQLEKIDERVDVLTQELSKKILGRALTIQDKKELLIEALEQANKDGVFDS